MLKYKNLTIIGTSHIAAESIEEVKAVIEKQKPSIVAVELDRKRFYALKNKIQGNVSIGNIPKIGFVGYLFALLGNYIQNKLGKMVKAKPGDEMLNAVDSASKVGAKVALIDQDINLTLQKLSKTFSFKEKMRVLGEIFKFIFFRKKAMKDIGIDIRKFDLTKVPAQDFIEKLMKRLEKGYPNLYRVLITERNIYMAKKLIKLMKKEEKGKVIAVVGAGHSEGLLRDIKNNINKLDFIG